MVVIPVKTSDVIIWNTSEVLSLICYAMSIRSPMVIDFLCEGPDFNFLSIKSFIIEQAVKYDYDLQQVLIKTSNIMQVSEEFRIEKTFPRHLQLTALEYDSDFDKNKDLKHFGLFIGRGNAPRLYLGSYLWNNFRNISLHTNHLDMSNDFYLANIGLESIIRDLNITNLVDIAKYLSLCPINCRSISINKSLDLNPAQQILKSDKTDFLSLYKNFFVEIVCETYFTGNTFFPTEKVWRPILLQTPFIVQGPQHFLRNIRRLGFQTFSQWWDEGYDDDPSSWSIFEIQKLLDSLSSKTQNQLQEILEDMKPVLEHNRKLYLEMINDPRLMFSEKNWNNL